ncbi:MAG: hypothetical protein WEC39_01260 [Patescibacteria group bacterium]
MNSLKWATPSKVEWEYLSVELAYDQSFISSKELSEKYGKEGWEMVGFCRTHLNYAYCYVFKRKARIQVVMDS